MESCGVTIILNLIPLVFSWGKMGRSVNIVKWGVGWVDMEVTWLAFIFSIINDEDLNFVICYNLN